MLKKTLLLFIFLIFFALIGIATAQRETPIHLPYQNNFVFNNSEFVLLSDQITPPLNIEYQITPKIVTEKKFVQLDIGSTEGTYKTIIRPSEQAWFTNTVKNKDNSAILFEDGFGKNYPSVTTEKKIFSVPNKGPYLIYLSGNDVSVDMLINAPNPNPSQLTMSNDIDEDQVKITPIITTLTPHTNDAGKNGSSQNNVIPILIFSLVIALIVFGFIEFKFISPPNKKIR